MVREQGRSVGGVRRRTSTTANTRLREHLAAKLVRSEHWHGLAPGDVVKVRGERGARFLFRCHVVNRANGATWVELDELAQPRRAPGGPPAAPVADERPVVRRQRAVEAERIVVVPRTPRRRRPEPQGVQGAFDFALLAEGDAAGAPAEPADQD